MIETDFLFVTGSGEKVFEKSWTTLTSGIAGFSSAHVLGNVISLNLQALSSELASFSGRLYYVAEMNTIVTSGL